MRGTRDAARTTVPWSLRDWRREHKPIFVENARAYMALYDTMSAAQADDVWKKLTGRDRTALHQGLVNPHICPLAINLALDGA